jgi:hypothetical protein
MSIKLILNSAYSILHRWNFGDASGLEGFGEVFPRDVALFAGVVEVAKLE